METRTLSSALSDMDTESVFTPLKSHYPVQTTPRRSERKRALFPTTSPQTSDLGHISPLESSPDQYSSAPASPDSIKCSPPKPKVGLTSPFGRKFRQSSTIQRLSPRKRFSELFKTELTAQLDHHASAKTSKSIASASITPYKSPHILDRSRDIVPADQLEQTILSAMDGDDIADSPLSHVSHHTPGSTPMSSGLQKSVLESEPSRPLTPSKRRNVPFFGTGSTSSSSPLSPKKQSKSSTSMNKTVELPRARLSLFSEDNPKLVRKRRRDDGIYLTGRDGKRRRTTGCINAGVRTGIRYPPKVNQKRETSAGKKHGKENSIRKVPPKSSNEKKTSLIPLSTLSLAPKTVKLPDVELATYSASTSIRLRAKNQSQCEMNEGTSSESSPESQSQQKIFKSKKTKRVATFTLSNNLKYKLSGGKFMLDRSSPKYDPTPKRRRKLFDLKQQRDALHTFDDDQLEKVAKCTRKEVQIILERLEQDVSSTSCSGMAESSTQSDKVAVGKAVVLQSEVERKDCRNAELRSLASGPLSPLSQLASSTSTLSLDIGGETFHLNQVQVQALSTVPDLIMDEDDEIPLAEPLPEQTSSPRASAPEKNTTLLSPPSGGSKMKKNDQGVTNSHNVQSEKYFPIFTHQTVNDMSSTTSTTESRKRKRPTWRPLGDDQYQIDAGQKRFGATECSECNVIYQLGDPEDEILHAEVHNSWKFLRHVGWKNENVVGEFGSDRVISVQPGDSKAWWSKVLQILSLVVDKDLGFANTCLEEIPNNSKAFMYVSKNVIVGCVVAQSLQSANRMLLSESECDGIDCCSKEEYSVKCGVSRIWVHSSHRRQQIATNLMDCMRKNFLIDGILSIEDLAFSAPSNTGKLFAEKYTAKKDYFVYLQE